MGPWAAAGAARSATTAARMPSTIVPDGRITYRLRRVRNSPAPTAAIAPTTTARSWRFSGAAGVMSGPDTVGPGDARSGSCRRNVVDAETAIESCAVTVRATDAPLGPPVDWARNATLTVLSAATVRFVPSVSEAATTLIVPCSTRAFVGLWIVTWIDALLAALPKLNGSEPGANVNCQSPGWPAKSTVSATFPVFRTTIVYETEPPAAIVRRCDASHVRLADRLTTFVSARFEIVSALTATDNVAW